MEKLNFEAIFCELTAKKHEIFGFMDDLWAPYYAS